MTTAILAARTLLARTLQGCRAPPSATRHLSAASAPRGLPKNESIAAPDVLLIDEHGARQGIQTVSTVLARLNRRQFDLVLVNATHVPPICRIVSRSGEFLRTKATQAAAARQARQRAMEKEVRFGTSMSEHDFGVRLRKLIELMERAHRVKVVIEPKGVMAGTPMAKERMLRRVMDSIADVAEVIAPPAIEMKSLVFVVTGNAKATARHSHRGPSGTDGE